MAKKKSGPRVRPIDKDFGCAHTKIMLQLSGNKELPVAAHASLMDLRKGDAAILEGIDLPTDDARRLMELGFVPGTRITAGNSAPGGDPRVFQVDGSEIALRRDRVLSIRAYRVQSGAWPAACEPVSVDSLFATRVGRCGGKTFG